MDFMALWQAYSKRADNALDGLLNDPAIPKELLTAMRYSIFAGGKRLRPTLVFSVSDMLGGDDSADILAAAIEMIHTYSLIHDDLPAMDNDSMRRGRATSHIVYGEAMAILAGDALLSHAFEMLLEKSFNAKNRDGFLKAALQIAKGASAHGMIAGQVVDMLSEENAEAGAKELMYIHEHKTGDMILSSILAGALLHGSGEIELEALKKYGICLGLAFQITDDVLDVLGDQKLMGKTLGKDKEENKVTFVKIYGIEKAQKMAEVYTQNAISALGIFGEKAGFLIQLAKYMLNRQH